MFAVIILNSHADCKNLERHLFVLSGQSNMVGMDPEVSFAPIVAREFGKDQVLVVKNAHSGQSIRR